MKREVIWTWSAEVDLQGIFDRSEEADAGNGEVLVSTIGQLLELLRQFPEMGGAWRKPVRRALIKRSRYGLFYVAEPTRLVVVAIQDLRQDPAGLAREIGKRLP